MGVLWRRGKRPSDGGVKMLRDMLQEALTGLPTLIHVIGSELWHSFSWRKAWRDRNLGRQIVRTVGWSGTSRSFFIDARTAWGDPAVIHRFLAYYGVRSYGFYFYRGLLVFCVRNAQAKWAAYLMIRATVPLVLDTRQWLAERERGQNSPPKAKR